MRADRQLFNFVRTVEEATAQAALPPRVACCKKYFTKMELAAVPFRHSMPNVKKAVITNQFLVDVKFSVTSRAPNRRLRSALVARAVANGMGDVYTLRRPSCATHETNKYLCV
jgi:hypothetical protein